MTKEELKLEALKYLENFKDCANCKHRWGDCADELDEDCLINNCYSATPKEQDIYLAGAEPREKRIAELEETCNKWFEHLKSREEELLNELNNQNCKFNKQIAELEKENADLKEEINKIAFARGNLEEENAELKGLVNQYKASKCSGISLVNRNMIMSDQLTKAKELLKEFVHHYKAKTIYIENMQDLLEQAEQFLSEVEK